MKLSLRLSTFILGKKNEGRGKKRQNPNIRAPDSKPKSIRSMFAAAAVKSKPKVQASEKCGMFVKWKGGN